MKWTQLLMSKNLSRRDDEMSVIADFSNLLGGVEKVAPERDYEEEYVQFVINRCRGLLMEAVRNDDIKPSDLASRLDVDRSLVTRFFRSGRDMKVSTLAIMARALGREWVIHLDDLRDKDVGNAPPVPIRLDGWDAETISPADAPHPATNWASDK